MDFTGVVALLTIFGAVTLIWGGWLLTRHRERMSIIDKGIVADDVKALYQRGPWHTNPLSSLKWGILFVALGCALLAGIWLREVYHTTDGVTVGLVALFGGLGLLLFYSLARKKIAQQ